MRVKVVKYQIDRPVKFISELFGNYLTIMEREDEKNEADKINSDISRQISSDMPGGRQRSYSQENLAP